MTLVGPNFDKHDGYYTGRRCAMEERMVRVRVLEGLMRELDLYLKKDERDVPKYLLHHCSMGSQVYSPYGWIQINPGR